MVLNKIRLYGIKMYHLQILELQDPLFTNPLSVYILAPGFS